MFFFRFSIRKPKKTQIAIIDRPESYLIERYLITKKKQYQIIDIRLESINLYVLFKLIAKKGIFKFKDYINLYLEMIECSILLSALENNLLFLSLKKKFKKKKFICLQQAWRSPFYFENKINLMKDAELDVMFTYNKKFSEVFSKSIKSKFVEIGSFRNNEVQKEKKSNTVSIAFVSEISIGSRNKFMDLSNFKIKSQDFYSEDFELIKLIANFCKVRNINFTIIGKHKHSWEKKFYENLLKGLPFKFISNYDGRNVYEICDKKELVIGTFSTLLLENLARGNKTFIFNTKIKSTNNKNYNIFFPNNINRDGDFWTDSIEKDKVNNYLEKIYNMKINDWDIILKRNENLLIKYDEQNKIFDNELKKYL